ncbi:Crp/Fnr family transcriptional regulator [Methylopila sp. Yamaguchi]|uniref:Crp/Fnr family transcriptional regulator n=1 Tax=Methylopila sp. Yamaguchi TaxID=1437817 RepID=UPI000CBB6F38|nr:Crp/Fnr family transcriptional regulator [Methylopila sp. Yamaguchi]GBD48477.1 cyclic nucleotide-binding protein [Methylopila sp. Yamaguchi]
MNGTEQSSGDMLLSEEQADAAAAPGMLGPLAPEDRARVEAHGRRIAYERGQAIFRQGDAHDGVMLIQRGLVRSFYAAPQGREITLAYWRPGAFVGGPDVFGGGRHIWAAEAARPTEALHLPGAGLRALAREVPDLALGIIDALAYKARCYSSLAQMLGTRSLGERLAHVLLHMMQIHGVPDDDPAKGVAIAASFTHAEIAALIGATRQWVTISLNRLQKDGTLSQKRGVLRILKPDAIVALATGGDRAG